MKISLNWLNEYVKVKDIDPFELEKLVNKHSVEIDSVNQIAKGSKLVIGYVTERSDHPQSDHLNVCKVDIGDEVLQIVCGAPNVDKGQKVIVALVGCELPAIDITIQKAVVRNVESNGMICSLSEIGFDPKNLKDEQRLGIEVLPEDAPIGENPLVYMGWDDTILELDLTPNRADCLSMIGFAHDIAAILDRKLVIPKVVDEYDNEEKFNLTVNTSNCPVFATKIIRGVKVKESPKWLQNYLTAAGVKVINNIVDISNFVLLEYGQPLHIYDLNKLENQSLVVCENEELEFVGLDDNEYKTSINDIVIKTGNRVACLAGVIGSNSTKVDENTVDIVIESAIFNHVSIRNTAKNNQLYTDAATRYIKKVNPLQTVNAINRAANLVKELAEGQSISKTYVTGEVDYNDKEIKLTLNEVNKILGSSLTVNEVSVILNRLNFNHTINNELFSVIKPKHRLDIEIKEDIIEEVGRIYGYDNLPITLPTSPTIVGGYNEFDNKINQIKKLLVGYGLNEIITYSLVAKDQKSSILDEQVALSQSMGEQRAVYRNDLFNSVVDVVKYNLARQVSNIQLFEIASCFTKEKNGKTSLEVKENYELAIVLNGNYQQTLWQQVKKPVDFYVAKGLVEGLLTKLGIDSSRYSFVSLKDDERYHPGRTAKLVIQGKAVGIIGQIHPTIIKNTFAIQINLTELLNFKSSKLMYTPMSIYPTVVRDIAIVINKDLDSGEVIKTIKQSGKKLIQSVEVFDVYYGEELGENKKSIAIKIIFVDPTKTLSENDVNTLMDNIISNINKKHNGVLREQ